MYIESLSKRKRSSGIKIILTLFSYWVYYPNLGSQATENEKIDDSRAMAGYFLTFEAPSALNTSLALRQAIWRKDDARWHICGVPSDSRAWLQVTERFALNPLPC
jgi:hypothetical protein